MRYSYVFVCFILFFSACSGSKKYYKKGLKLEEATMFEEASQMYLQSLARNNENIDAKIRLKRTGQIVLDTKFGDVFKAHGSDNHKGAVYAYLDAQDFMSQVKSYNVQLSAPPQYEQYFTQSKNIYLANIYLQATELLGEEKFEAADPILAEIKELDPNYKDVGNLKRTSSSEPLYRSGRAELQAKSYRQAYYYFDQIYQNDKSYKDVGVLREKARKEASITVSVLPFQNYTRQNNIEKTIQSNVIGSVLSLKSPFIDLVDRDNLQTILDEQKFGLSGQVNEASAAKVGNLLGVKAVLIGKVTNYSSSTNGLRTQDRVGYESYAVKEYNATTKQYDNATKYRRTNYKEYSDQRSVNVSFEYQLISSETGKILASNAVSKLMTDEITYADYQGDRRNLFPGDNDGVFFGGNEKKRLDNVLQGRRSLRNEYDIIQSAQKQIADEVAADVFRVLGK